MHLPTVALAFIAAAATALPTSAVAEGELQYDERDFLEIVTLERKAFLSARDLELAARHGADANEMYPHSVIRRKNGDDITIWVNNNFVDEAPSTLDKRQSARPNTGAYVNQGAQAQKICQAQSIPPDQMLTRPDSAFTGGIEAMSAWGYRSYGYFKFAGQAGTSWSDVILGGSNSGANARFSIRKWSSDEARIGTGDVGILTNYMLRFKVKYGNSWRAAGEGGAACGAAYVSFEVKKTDKTI